MPDDPSMRQRDTQQRDARQRGGALASHRSASHRSAAPPARQPQPASPVASVSQAAPVSQADDDEHLVRLWLHGKSENTKAAYRRDLGQFVDFADAPLQQVRLQDLQDYADHLQRLGLAKSTRARKLSAVKSLLSFGHEVGYLIYNVGAPVKAPRPKETLAERILSEAEVQRLLAMESPARNHALLRFLYAAGARVSEAAGLRVRDLAERAGADGKAGRGQAIRGQVTLYGKGEKTRRVLLSAETWRCLRRLTTGKEPGAAVFESQKGGPLSRSQIFRIVRKAARRAGIQGDVSPHWLRHAHASHALDRGAPAHLVRDTLGHGSVATTDSYLHARPDESSSTYLGV